MPTIDGHIVTDKTTGGEGLSAFMQLGSNYRWANFDDAKKYGKATFGEKFILECVDGNFVIKIK